MRLVTWITRSVPMEGPGTSPNQSGLPGLEVVRIVGALTWGLVAQGDLEVIQRRVIQHSVKLGQVPLAGNSLLEHLVVPGLPLGQGLGDFLRVRARFNVHAGGTRRADQTLQRHGTLGRDISRFLIGSEEKLVRPLKLRPSGYERSLLRTFGASPLVRIQGALNRPGNYPLASLGDLLCQARPRTEVGRCPRIGRIRARVTDPQPSCQSPRRQGSGRPIASSPRIRTQGR
jgi:hypothetical protein